MNRFLLLSFLLCLISCKDIQSPLAEAESSLSHGPQLNLDNEEFEGFQIDATLGQAVKVDGQLLLSYELDLQNASQQVLELESILLRNFEDDQVLARFDSAYLDYHLLRPGLDYDAPSRTMVPNSFAVANLWWDLDSSSIPEHFYHQFIFKVLDSIGTIRDRETLHRALLPYPEVTDLVLRPPFRAGNWFYVANAHRDARLLTHGKASFPQRYAIDWVKVNEDFRLQEDSVETIESFVTYGQELLAVADGRVVFTKDGIPDNDPFSYDLAVEINRETVAGNYVVVDIGEGIYAFYGHLIPGSLKVKVGDQLIAGEVLGQLGNSGRSFAPHLHFHLETASPYPLGGEGIPYVFEDFKVIQSYPDEAIATILADPYQAIYRGNTDSLPQKRKEFISGNGLIKF